MGCLIPSKDIRMGIREEFDNKFSKSGMSMINDSKDVGILLIKVKDNFRRDLILPNTISTINEYFTSRELLVPPYNIIPSLDEHQGGLMVVFGNSLQYYDDAIENYQETRERAIHLIRYINKEGFLTEHIRNSTGGRVSAELRSKSEAERIFNISLQNREGDIVENMKKYISSTISNINTELDRLNFLEEPSLEDLVKIGELNNELKFLEEKENFLNNAELVKEYIKDIFGDNSHDMLYSPTPPDPFNPPDPHAWQRTTPVFNEEDFAALDELQNLIPVMPEDFQESPYRDYIVNKNRLIKQLQQRKESLEKLHKYGTQEYVDKVEPLDNLLSKLYAELEELEESAETVLEDMKSELESIKEVIEDLDVELLQNLEIFKRLEDLQRFANNTLSDGTFIPEDKTGEVHNELKRDLDSETLSGLQKDIEEVARELQNKTFEILQDIIENNIVVQQNIKDGFFKDSEGNTLTQDQVLELLKNEILKLKGVSNLNLNFLGMGWQGILGQIVKLTFQQNSAEITAHDLPRMNLLKRLVKKLEGVVITYVDNTGNTVSRVFKESMLLQKDKEGNPINRLLNIFTPKYFQTLKGINTAKSEFFSASPAEKNTKYNEWLDFQRENTDVIDIRKLKVVRDFFATKGWTQFDHYFVPETEMDDYYSELEKVVGKRYLKILIEQQLEKMERFAEFCSNNTVNPTVIDLSNPFSFIEKFEGTLVNNEYQTDQFNLYIPKSHTVNATGTRVSTKFYSPEYFSLIENNANNDIFELWSTLRLAFEEDINPRLASFGLHKRNWELPNIAEEGIVSAVKNAKGFGKVTTAIKEIGIAARNLFVETNRRDTDKIHVQYHKADAKMNTNLTQMALILYSISQNALASQKTLFTSKLAIQYAKSQANMADRSAVEGLQRLEQALIFNEEHNIKKNTAAEDNKGSFGRFLSKTVMKILSSQDKAAAVRLRNLVANVSTAGKFHFTVSGVKYEKNDNGEYFMTDELGNQYLIDEQTLTDAYEIYVNEEISKLGLDVTIRSILMGMMGIRIWSKLGLNIASGIKNLYEGQMQNYIAAAQGRFGLNEEVMAGARKFLTFANAGKLLSSLSRDRLLSLRGKRVGLEHKTLKLFLETFNLVQDRKNILATTEQYATDKSGSLPLDMMEFSVGMPEYHNQTALIVGILAVTKIYNQDTGEYDPVFDIDKQQFVYIPGTLTLKPQYRTDENIRQWEQMRVSRTGENAGIAALAKMTSLIERTQGNFNPHDIVKLLGTTMGKIFMMFKRWLPEHVNAQYRSGKSIDSEGGMTEDLDLIEGRQGLEGRKTNLMRHAPTAGLYLISAGVLAAAHSIVGIPLAIAFTTPILGYMAFQMYKQIVNKQIKWNVDELKYSLEFTMEVISRSITTPLDLITRGRINAQKYYRQGVTPLFKYDGITKQDREMLSANAQDIANQFTLATTLILGKMALLALMGAGGDDDDDMTDEEKERRNKYLARIEAIMNWWGNMHSELLKGLGVYNNPQNLASEHSRMAYFGILSDIYDIFSHIAKAQEKDEDVSVVVLEDLMKMNTPSVLKNMTLYQTPVGADRQFSTMWYEKAMLRTEEESIELQYNILHQKLKNAVSEAVNNDKSIPLDDKKKNIDRIMRKSYQRQGKSTEETKKYLETIDFDKEIKYWKEVDEVPKVKEKEEKKLTPKQQKAKEKREEEKKKRSEEWTPGVHNFEEPEEKKKTKKKKKTTF